MPLPRLVTRLVQEVEVTSALYFVTWLTPARDWNEKEKIPLAKTGFTRVTAGAAAAEIDNEPKSNGRGTVAVLACVPKWSKVWLVAVTPAARNKCGAALRNEALLVSSTMATEQV